MRSCFVSVIATVVFLAGCSSETAPPPKPASPSAKAADRVSTPPTDAGKPPVAHTVKKPAAEDQDTAKKPLSDRTMDDFGLPLVIVLETPEVPQEIMGPSPPIKELPKPPPKKKGGWW